MKSRDIALVGILLAAGAIARYISLFIPGAIVANLTIAFYCLAIILVVPKYKEALGIGVVAGIICAVFSHSVFPLGNLISEPIGAISCLFVYKAIQNHAGKLSSTITAAIATAVSGFSFIGITFLVMIAPSGATIETMIAFITPLIPIVLGAVVVNAIIVQIIALPAAALMRKSNPIQIRKHESPANKESVIELKNVSYAYDSENPVFVLKDLNLKIEKGEFAVVTGSSGAGKTTFCKTIAGITLHSYGGILKGEMTIDGKYADEYKEDELCETVGMVFDDADAQLIFTTVEEEIRTGLETRKLKECEIEEKLKELYRLTNTKTIKDQAPHTLSGGQKQRVAFAAALSKETPILILDEATSELDKDSRKQIYVVLKKLAESGKTIVLVEHMIDETIDYATRQIRLENGKIVYDGVPMKDTAAIPAFFKKPASNTKPAAVVKNAVHIYGNNLKALDGVSMELYAGEITAIVGENGSGKTTLIKHLNGLLKPTLGTVEVLDQNIEKMKISDISKSVGLVFQNPDTMLFENTCFKEVLFGLKNIRPEKENEKDTEEDALTALKKVGLLEKKDTNPRHLSRGERQRLALACVIAMNQPILILDEPTTGLDLKESFEIMEQIIELRNEGKSVLMITHSPKIAETVADCVIEMALGKITNVTKVPSEISNGLGEMIKRTDIDIGGGI